MVMWRRSCAKCGKELRKQHLAEVLTCICGWVWGQLTP